MNMPTYPVPGILVDFGQYRLKVKLAVFIDASITIRPRDTLAAAITSTTATSITVDHGAWFAVNDIITIDSEQLKITAKSTNTLTVARAQNSTVATTHVVDSEVFGPDFSEGSAAPATRQYWPDYSTGADGDDAWNTGTILLNSAQAGMMVAATYKGLGSLVDSRLLGRRIAVFLASGSWTPPPGVTDALVLLSGGGGGGGGGIGAPTESNTVISPRNGSTGGASSFGAYLSASGGIGGGGAQLMSSSYARRTGTPAASGGVLGSPGGHGGYGQGDSSNATMAFHGADGAAGQFKAQTVADLIQGLPITITIGDGGNGAAAGNNGGAGTAGADGYAIVIW